jgi:DNA-binding SARP family transcriptional activator/tetratricopeptide (TPR) repeat protein
MRRNNGGASDCGVPAPGLRIGVLGPLLVSRDGAPLPSMPAGQRTVLGLLALANGSPLTADSVIDVLWPDGPPASAAGILQTYVSRLRRRLLDPPNGGRAVVRDGAGYRLAVTAASLDLLAFRGLVAEAVRASGTGKAGEACTAYEQALALWRGEPLADVPALRGHPVVTALADERAAAVLDYADIALAGGWHERALPHLRALAGRDPLDEASQSRLMIALAGSGRQAYALEVYEEVRRRLDAELGVLPGPLLQDAHAKVLRQQIGHAPAWLPLFQLPAAPADFTGRLRESASLTEAITPRPEQSGVPLVVLSGPPGAGKTALALHVAHTVHDRFPDGQLWVHLAGTSARPRDPGEVLGEFLRALGVHGMAIPATISERAVCYRSRLAGRRILVVADDAATAAQALALLPGTPGCALLVTSRSHLEGLDGARLLPLDMMSAEDAARLLTRMVGTERVAAEPSAADGLVQACGALPLALRIAGAKLAARPSWSLSTMTRRITGVQARLRELESADLSVRMSISSSYNSLPAVQRRAFRLLALAGPGDFAEWVAGALTGVADVRDVLNDLTERSLVLPLGADATGEPRYRLHDLLREYAAERLAEDRVEFREETLGRLLSGWLQLAMLADARLPREPYFPPLEGTERPRVVPLEVATRLTADAVAWFDTERVNLLTAVEQACRAGQLDLARRLAAHLCAFQHLQYRQDDAERMWRDVAEAAGARHGTVARYARIRLGASLVQQGRAVDAVGVLDQCIAEPERGGEREALALALEWRATCAWDLNDFARARDFAERGVEVARRARSLVAEHRNLGQLGSALSQLGHCDQAVAMAERALEIAAGLGIPSYELVEQQSAALVSVWAGQHERAVAACMRALELSRMLGDSCGEALSYGLLGDAYHGLGRYSEAASSLLKALPTFRDHGIRRFNAVCLLKLGYAYEALGSAEAIGYLEESLEIFRQLSLPCKAQQAQQALERCRTAM